VGPIGWSKPDDTTCLMVKSLSASVKNFLDLGGLQINGM